MAALLACTFTNHQTVALTHLRIQLVEISHIPTTLSSLLSTMRRDASHEVRAFTEMSKPLGNEDNKREHAVYSISRPPFSKLEPS